jgi:hypothetical protein
VGCWRLSSHNATVEEAVIDGSTCGCASMDTGDRIAVHHCWTFGERAGATRLHKMASTIYQC